MRHDVLQAGRTPLRTENTAHHLILSGRLRFRFIQLMGKLPDLLRGCVTKPLEVIQELLLVAHREYARFCMSVRKEGGLAAIVTRTAYRQTWHLRRVRT